MSLHTKFQLPILYLRMTLFIITSYNVSELRYRHPNPNIKSFATGYITQV